jgi:hypothetical protein
VTIFKDIQRTDSSLKKNDESIFNYLDKSNSHISEYLRLLLNSWFNLFPIEKQNSLSGAFTKKDDEKFKEAFCEMYIHKMLLDIGSEVSIEPHLIEGSQKNPDFLEICSNNRRAVIEVTTKYHQTKEQKASLKSLDSLIDGINLKISPKGFYFSVEMDGILPNNINRNEVIKKINNWIKQLQIDFGNLNLKKQESVKNSLQINFDNGTLGLRLYKTQSNFSQVVGSTGTFLPPTINIYELIKKAIIDKTHKYKSINLPFLLVLNLETYFGYPEDIIPCLYPKSYEIPKDGFFHENPEKRPLFFNQKCSFISGILVLKNSNPFNILGMDPTLFINPNANLPYKGNLLRLSKYLYVGGKECYEAGLDATKVLKINREIFY